MKRFKHFCLFLLSAILLLNIFILSPVQALSFGNSSSLTGLATLKNLAKNSLAYEDAISINKPILVEFYADWCTVCQSMSPVISHLKQEYHNKINLVAINIDNPEFNSLVLDYEVTGVPQFTFLNSQHQIVENLVGKIPEKFMANILEQLS